MLILFLYKPDCVAMQDLVEFEEGFSTGFDLNTKKFYKKPLAEYYSPNRELLTQEIKAAHIISKLLAAQNADEQKSAEQLLQKHINRGVLEKIAEKGNVGAALLLLDTNIMDYDQQERRKILATVQNAIAYFNTTNEFGIKTFESTNKSAERVFLVMKKVLTLCENLEIQKKLESYAQMTQDHQAYHILAAIKAASGFMSVEKKEGKDTHFLDAIALYEKVLTDSMLSVPDKKQIEKDLAYIHHSLALLVYYNDNPKQAYRHLCLAKALDEIDETKIALAYLLLTSYAKESTSEEKQWAEEYFVNHVQTKLEEYIHMTRNLAMQYGAGHEAYGVEKNNKKSQKYWKLLADATFESAEAITIRTEACNRLAEKYFYESDQITEDTNELIDKAETYFKKVVAAGDNRGWLGVGRCKYKKGKYTEAAACFDNVISHFKNGTLKLNEINSEVVRLTMALWCKGTLLFTSRIPGGKNEGIALLHLALEKIPSVPAVSFLIDEVPKDIMHEITKDVIHCDDPRFLYIIGRIFLSVKETQEVGLQYIRLAAQNNHNWAQLYLGVPLTMGEKHASQKALWLTQVQKKSDADECFALANSYLCTYASSGILAALLQLAKQHYQEGALDEWLSNLNPQKIQYEHLFNNHTDEVNIQKILNDQTLYTQIMSNESISGRILKTIILMKKAEFEKALQVGEKLLPELKKVSAEVYAMWQQFLMESRIHIALLYLNKDEKSMLEEEIIRYFCTSQKNNMIGSLVIAVFILTEKIAPDAAKKILKKYDLVSSKQSVKEYAQNKIEVIEKQINKLNARETDFCSCLFLTLSNYYCDKKNLTKAKKYVTIAKELGNTYADSLLNTINLVKQIG